MRGGGVHSTWWTRTAVPAAVVLQGKARPAETLSGMAVASASRFLQTAEARLKQWRRSLPGEALWIVGLTILLVRGPISVLFTLYSGASDSDFEIFYDAARSWREGGTAYPTTTTGPNLTLPHVMPVFRALSYAPFPVALTLWLIASVASAWMAVRMTRRTIGLTTGPSLRMSILVWSVSCSEDTPYAPAC